MDEADDGSDKVDLLDGVISTQKIRLLDDDDSEEVEMFDRLPDDILCHILSFLELEDAIRAKLLSRRWRHLYPENPTLCFQSLSGFSRRAELKFSPIMLVQWMDEVMQQFRAPKIKAFELSDFYLRWVDYASYVDQWIQLACLMNTEEIELTWNLSWNRFPGYQSYKFPFHLLHAAGSSNLKDLRISCCYLTALSSLAGPITSLRVLILWNVCFPENSGTTFDDIPSYFPNLEELSLTFCEQLTSMRQLVGLCVRLLYLKSLNITTGKEDFFDTHSANLTNFASFGRVNLSFKGLNCLKDLYIFATMSGQCAANFLHNLPAEAPQLAKLTIDTIYCSKDFQFPSFMSTFKCLRYLKLYINISQETDLRNLSKVVQVAPLLNVLKITLRGESEPWEQLLPQHVHKKHHACEMHHAHSHLKLVTFDSHYFGQNVVELIIILLKCATSLEEMILFVLAKSDEKLREVLAPCFPKVKFTTSDYDSE